MNDNLDNLKKTAEEVAGTAKEKLDETLEKVKDSEVGKAVLGEDGKFDKEDVERLTQEAKDSKVGKAVLGEDGKFDKEDVDRIATDVKEAAKNVVDKVKDIFNK